jgi:hypothetical protein
VDLNSYEHDLEVDPVAAARVRDRGPEPQNAHEEMLMMRRLYNEAVLGVKSEERELVQIR